MVLVLWPHGTVAIRCEVTNYGHIFHMKSMHSPLGPLHKFPDAMFLVHE